MGQSIQTYYDNESKIKEKYFIINNKKEGEYVKYYENGNIYIECSYVNGKLDGEYIKYYIDGQIEEKYNYTNGILESIFDYENGKIISKYKYCYKNNEIDKIEYIFINK